MAASGGHGCHRLARRAPRRVLEPARRQHRDLCRRRDDAAASAASPTTPRRRMSNRPGRRTAGGIVWASGRPGAHDLFVMDRDGAHKQRLAGGRRQRRRARLVARRHAHRVRLEPGRPLPAVARRLVRRDAGAARRRPGRARAPDWSPNGDRLAYTGIVGGASDVWVVSLDGFTRRRLTSAPAFDGRPNWSPDGRRLAFVSKRGGARRIWLMRADGSARAAAAGLGDGDDAPSGRSSSAAIAPDARSCCPISTSGRRAASSCMRKRTRHDPRFHVGRRQHRRRRDPHPRHAGRGRSHDAGRPARPSARRRGAASCGEIGRLGVRAAPAALPLAPAAVRAI